MRAVVQRVSRASVSVEGKVRGEIGRGLLVLLAAVQGDGEPETAFMARKIAGMRIFPDAQDKMNLDVGQAGGAVLVVSQFTLAAQTSSGNRPSFSSALPPQEAMELLEKFMKALRNEHGLDVASGEFGARMAVELVNDGPVTIIVDTQRSS